ncbi:MAG TPA: hypothetical protein VIR57_02630 [Chloroflexota bacterium]|jgi:hypothetical protein
MDAINGGINNFINILTGIAFAGFILFIIVGGLILMSAGGNPRQMEKGKTAMMNAVGGFAIIITARAVAGLIQSSLPH